MNATAPTTATPTPYEPIIAFLERIAATDLNGDIVQYISFIADHALINAAKLTLARVREEIREMEAEDFQPIFEPLQYIGDTTPGEVGQFSFMVDPEIIHAAEITLTLVRRIIDELVAMKQAAQLLFQASGIGLLSKDDFLALSSAVQNYKALTGMPLWLKRSDGSTAKLGV